MNIQLTFLLVITCLFSGYQGQAVAETFDTDVVIYGSTSAAVNTWSLTGRFWKRKRSNA